jgi:uridine phosphorylase
MRLLLIFAALSCALAQAHNVAIVGAGIGAAQAAISLRELIPNDLNIDV